jgi:hypothetical protein
MTTTKRQDERPESIREPTAALSAEERRVLERIQQKTRTKRRKPLWRRLPDSTFFWWWISLY